MKISKSSTFKIPFAYSAVAVGAAALVGLANLAIKNINEYSDRRFERQYIVLSNEFYNAGPDEYTQAMNDREALIKAIDDVIRTDASPDLTKRLEAIKDKTEKLL